MLPAFGRSSPSACVLIFSAISTLTHSQAPFDAEGNQCTKKTVPDGVVRLLDSRWYIMLLSNGSQNAGWTQTPSGSVSE